VHLRRIDPTSVSARYPRLPQSAADRTGCARERTGTSFIASRTTRRPPRRWPPQPARSAGQGEVVLGAAVLSSPHLRASRVTNRLHAAFHRATRTCG